MVKAEVLPQKFTEPLDFPFILFGAIRDTMKARFDNDMDKYIRGVEDLCDLLECFSDDEYVEDMNKAKEEYENNIKHLRLHLYEDQEKKRYYKELWARKVFRALMRVINRGGLLPMREFIEVWE